MDRPLTKLQKGILVEIDNDQLDLLQKESGFLSRESYPNQYEKISLPNEVGRFLIFRFLTKPKVNI